MLMAGDVKLAQPLKDPLSQIGAQGQSALAMALGKLRTQATTSNRASGRVQGPYQEQALTRAGTQAGRGINDALYSALGNTSYQDTRNQAQFERQMALAREIGDKMSPSTAEEVLGGLSQGINLGAKGAGIYQALGQGKSSGGSNPLSIGNYSPAPNSYDYTRDPRYTQPMSYDMYDGGY